MQLLEYEAPQPRWTATRAALIALPVAAAVITWFVFLRFAHDEPIMVFTIGDAIFYVGHPLIVLVMWLVWFWLAWRKRAVPGIILCSVACWAAGNLWVAHWLLVCYLKEPWSE
jgi:hypothetical protein